MDKSEMEKSEIEKSEIEKSEIEKSESQSIEPEMKRDFIFDFKGKDHNIIIIY